MQLFILSWDFFQLQTFYFIAFSSIFSILCIGLDYPRFCPSFVLGFYFFFMLQVKKCEIFVLSKNSNLSIKLFTLPLNHVGMCSISWTHSGRHSDSWSEQRSCKKRLSSYLSVLFKSVFHEIDFLTWFFFISNLIFTACVACKNQVQNRQKIKFKKSRPKINFLK